MPYGDNVVAVAVLIQTPSPILTFSLLKYFFLLYYAPISYVDSVVESTSGHVFQRNKEGFNNNMFNRSGHVYIFTMMQNIELNHTAG